MTATTVIVERLLGNLEEKGTGIFVKHLSNGPLYTCRCPQCGTFHGGYSSFAEAEVNLKCRMCNRNAVEKRKKEIAKVDEPEPKKNIFQNPDKKPVVIGEADEFDDEDVKSILGDPAASDEFKVDKGVCMNAHYRQEFYSRLERAKNGFPLRVRVSGKCKTWTTRPNEYRLPVKFGLYQSFYITHANEGDFSTWPLDKDGKPIR